MPIAPEARRRLLAHARSAIRSRLERTPLPEAPANLEGLEEKTGVFVSLHTRDGDLRGCIGTFASEDPLHRTVRDMAISAAVHDPRFPPLSASDLDRVEIEISVLSPMREVRDPGEIVVGEHGIYVTAGPYRGVLLPQVALEHGWDRETFLDQTCRKAGLSPRRWRDPDVKTRIFSAEVFGERTDDVGS